MGMACQIFNIFRRKEPYREKLCKAIHKKPQSVLWVGERECISQDNATVLNKLPNPKLKTTKGLFLSHATCPLWGPWGSSSLQDVGSQNASIWSLEFLVTKQRSKCSSHMFTSRTSTWMAFKGESISPKGETSNIGALKCSRYRQYGKNVRDRGFPNFSRPKNSVKTLLTGPTQLP